MHDIEKCECEEYEDARYFASEQQSMQETELRLELYYSDKAEFDNDEYCQEQEDC